MRSSVDMISTFGLKLIYADFSLKLILINRPYGGLIGIDKSSLKKHLKHFILLRLHAVLHDAAGYLQEKTNCPIKIGYLGHVTGIAFCIFLKSNQSCSICWKIE